MIEERETLKKLNDLNKKDLKKRCKKYLNFLLTSKLRAIQPSLYGKIVENPGKMLPA